MKALKVLIFMVLLFFKFNVEAAEEEILHQGFKSLKNLSLFKDVVVLQKRYFPKTHRASLSLKGGGIMNDAYFTISGVGTDLGFYFTERWGINVDYFFLNSSKKQHTEALLSRGVDTSFLSLKKKWSAGLKWVPMYGKVAFRDKRIVYFDHYFSLGYGGIELDTKKTSPVFYLGMGQLFPLNKSWVVNWDISLNRYTAAETIKSNEQDEQTRDRKIEQIFYAIVFNVGISFFYPGAGYR